jgi:nucleotide-binding universal stress UspA family protein
MIMVSPDYSSVEALQKDAERYLNSVADALREHGFQVRIKVEIGDPAQVIVQSAASLDADMIIMSTHGRSGISRWLFGSITGRVLGIATRPVLVVPSQEFQHKFEREASEVNVG